MNKSFLNGNFKKDLFNKTLLEYLSCLNSFLNALKAFLRRKNKEVLKELSLQNLL